MPETLRPLSLGEVLDRTAQLYRRNFLLFTGVAAVPAAVMVGAMIARTVLSHAVKLHARGTSTELAIATLIEFLLLLAAVSYSHPVLTCAAVHAHFGRAVNLRETALSVLPRYRRFLGLTTLQALFVLGVPAFAALLVLIPFAIVIALFKSALAPEQIGWIAILVLLAILIGALWLVARVALAVAVCWVEDKTAWASLKRAAALSKGARGKIAMTLLFCYAIAFIVVMVRLAIVAMVTAIGKHAGHPLAGPQLLATQVFEVLFSFATEILLAPLVATGFAILYYDQRVRLEGYDIEWMMQQAGLESPEKFAGLSVAEQASMALPEPATVKEL